MVTIIAGVRGEGLGVRGMVGRQALTPNPSPLTPIRVLLARGGHGGRRAEHALLAVGYLVNYVLLALDGPGFVNVPDLDTLFGQRFANELGAVALLGLALAAHERQAQLLVKRRAQPLDPLPVERLCAEQLVVHLAVAVAGLVARTPAQ